MPRDPNTERERLRSRQACLNCRRKKTRCPAEKPACSNCVRLRQSCTYVAGDPRNSDRLACLEKKVDLLLKGSGARRFPSEQLDEGALLRDSPETLEATCDVQQNGNLNGSPLHSNQTSTRRSWSGPSSGSNGAPSVGLEILEPEIPHSTIAEGIDLYFELFHRQPIWCFDRRELEHRSEISSEVACSILELTARFSRQRDSSPYGDMARRSILLRVANGAVELETIECLCLLSYSAFIDGNSHLGQFYLSLGFQLCRSARMDRGLTSQSHNLTTTERRKRVFWSLQSLEQFYSEQDSVLGTAPEVWRSYYVSNNGDAAFPHDINGPPTSTDLGIWTLAAHFGWVWSRVREYVSECYHGKLTEPWRLDSTYAKVLADMTEVENKVPWCHRYDSVKFYERQADEVSLNKSYWIPWIKLQVTWHSILVVLNHPFLYIVASQHHPNLAIPNTFWRRSSEIVLLHATWIVRVIDMVWEKGVKLIDPFFGHAAAIAATVHLYFCCAADPRLKQKSKADFVKCKRFLSSFAWFSPACKGLLQSLDKMTQIAARSENVDDDDWLPSKIHLSIPLMWDVLLFKVPQGTSSAALLHASFAPTDARGDKEEDRTLDISVAASPQEVIIDSAAAHNAGLPPYMTTISSSLASPNGSAMRDIVLPPADSLMFNTPWLWAESSSQCADMDTAAARLEPDPAVGEGYSTWWDFGNL